MNINLNKIDIVDIDKINNKDDNIINKFYFPINLIIKYILKYLNDNNINNNIIDVGCGMIYERIFPKADYILGKNIKYDLSKYKFIDLDLDFDVFPQKDYFFNFIYCRHTLEDIQNPQHCFSELIRLGKTGYIETPSPIVEFSKNIEHPIYRGFIHHRYITWSDITTNTLYFIPKYPIIEHLEFDSEIEKKINYLLNNNPFYWNNYFFWDINTKPNIFVYRHDINFNINTYNKILVHGIYKSIEYSNVFFNKINQMEIN